MGRRGRVPYNSWRAQVRGQSRWPFLWLPGFAGARHTYDKEKDDREVLHGKTNFRNRLLVAVATYRAPSGPNAIPLGSSRAAVAGPPSPENPRTPFPRPL